MISELACVVCVVVAVCVVCVECWDSVALRAEEPLAPMCYKITNAIS